MMRVIAVAVWAVTAAIGFTVASSVSLASPIAVSADPPVAAAPPIMRTPVDVPDVRSGTFVRPAVPVALRPAPSAVIRLTGLLGGDRPAALLDGIPGVPGTVMLSPGDSAGGVWLLAIAGGEAVVLSGADTLRLRQSEER